MSQPEEQKSDEASAEGPASAPSAPPIATPTGVESEISDPAMAAPLPATLSQEVVQGVAQVAKPENQGAEEAVESAVSASVPEPLPAEVLEDFSGEIPEVDPDAVMELDDPTHSAPMDDFAREATDEHIRGFEEDPPTQPGVISQFELASGDPAASGDILSPVAETADPETAEGRAGGSETTDEKSSEPAAPAAPPKVLVDATLALPDNDPPAISPPPMATYDDTPVAPGIPPRDGRNATPEAEPEIADAQKAGQATGAAAWFDDSFDDGYTMEGAPLFDDDTGDGTHEAPLVGQEMVTTDGVKVVLEDSLGEASGRIFFRAQVGEEGTPFTAVWIPHRLPEPDWNLIPDPRIVRPVHRIDLENSCVKVFERPKGSAVADFLSSDERFLPALAVMDLGIEVAEILESVHGAGLMVYDLDPAQFVIERGGNVRLYALEGFFRPLQVTARPFGIFAAPEARQRLTYRMGAHSDVYAAALMLYGLLAKGAPLTPDLDPAHLVSPRVFRPTCPLGIWPFLRNCLDASPENRVGHARGFKAELRKARARILEVSARSEDENPEPLALEGWAETHPGLAKSRRGSDQQDRAVSVTTSDGRAGLFVIADGVSRCKFGDGAFAAEQVTDSANEKWNALGEGGEEAFHMDHAQRSDVLRQITYAAGKRIAQEANQRHAPMANEPNQVMSTTMVGAYIVDDEVTMANLGDSRGYLIRHGSIEQITIDHDRKTDAMRLGLPFKDAVEVRAGTALTRIVGRVYLDETGLSHHDPFEPEIFTFRLLPGDRILICSDGLADFAAGAGTDGPLSEAAMLQVLEEYDDPIRAAYELVVLANRAGGYDNISCVVIAAHSV
jgi:serine/threonine protein phosphatase PrpC